MKAKQSADEKEKTIFQDSQNRTYNIRITILTIDAIRDRLGIDITEPQDLLTVSLDPVRFVVWFLPALKNKLKRTD